MGDPTLREVELELQRRKHEDPLELVYIPHEAQQEAHRSRKMLTLVLGGNRAGKTWFAVAEALYYCLGRSKFAETVEPPVTIWYVMPSLPMFRRAVVPVLRKLVPRDQVRLTATGDLFAKNENVVRFKNGSTLHFLSADMRQRRLQGAPVDIVIMDETPDEVVFEEMQARIMDRRGRIILVFSPIDLQTYWVRDTLYLPWAAGDRRDIDIILMPVADKQGHSLVPHFTDEDIKTMERQWPDPAVRAARMYGEFMARAGIVFKQFEHAVHVIKAFTVPDSYSRWMVCDPEYHRFAVLYYAADENGTYYVTNEYFSQDEPLARRAEKLKLIVGDLKKPIPMYVDSANPQDMVELGWHFERMGVKIGPIPLPFPKHVEKMVLRTHSLLEPDDEREYPKILGLKGLYGSPRLFFFDNLTSSWKHEQRDMQCSRLLWELQRLSWKDDKPNKDSADGADCSDCLIYGCNVMVSGVRPPPGADWKNKLSIGDRIVWEAIERMDNRRTLPFSGRDY